MILLDFIDVRLEKYFTVISLKVLFGDVSLDSIFNFMSPSQKCSQWPPAEKTGRGSLLSHPSYLSDDSIGRGTELNGTGSSDGVDFSPLPGASPCGLTFTWWGCCSLCLWHKPTELSHTFFFCSCVCFCLYGPFNCISFHKFSQQLSAFSLCSSDLISVLLALSTIYLFMKVSLSADIILCVWLGLKHQPIN